MNVVVVKVNNTCLYDAAIVLLLNPQPLALQSMHCFHLPMTLNKGAPLLHAVDKVYLLIDLSYLIDLESGQQIQP